MAPAGSRPRQSTVSALARPAVEADELAEPDADRQRPLPEPGRQSGTVLEHRRSAAFGPGRHLRPVEHPTAPHVDDPGGDLRASHVDADGAAHPGTGDALDIAL